jgi:dihydrofolate reductase
MKVSLIVAAAQNRVIGRNNNLPWYLPNDLKYFKQATMGKPIIMGRKTYDSIGKPLPGRPNIIITRNSEFTAEGVIVARSLKDAIAQAEDLAFINGAEEVMIIGGAQIYAESLPSADRLYLTEVHADVEGDAYFPEYDANDWQEQGREDFTAIDPNPYDYSFVVYDRVK